MIRRNITVAGCALALMLMFGGTKAHASTVQFVYNGGSYSLGFHSGWNRYWGGPAIGFYYAPAPVYLVDGYSAATYYTGPGFWYSNPSFGLSLTLGGGGGYYGGGYGGGHTISGGGGRSFGGGGHSFSGGGGHGSGHSVGGHRR